MQKSIILTLFGILAFAMLAVAQEDGYVANDDVEDADVAASNIASSLGIDGNVLYEDLIRIRDQVVPLAEQYNNN